MTWDEMAKVIMEKPRKNETVQKLWNACSAAMARISAEEGLKEGLRTIAIYEHDRGYYTKKFGEYGWRPAREVLGSDYESRREKEEAKRPRPAPEKKLKCGCPCRVEGTQAVTTGSCGKDGHVEGRVIKLKQS